MSSAFYTGGYSLADLIRELYQLHRSLSAVQGVLAELLISGEIVPLEEIPPGWYLEWASVHESGEGWARLGGRKIIVIVIDGKQRDPAKIRYRRPLDEPRPPTPSEPVAEEEPDPPPPATEGDPPASGAASLPPGHWHVLAVVLEGWHQGGLSVPLMQEYFARLTESGAIKLSEALPEVWMMGSQRFGGHVTGKKHFLFIAPGGKELWASEIGCQLSDPRILDPRQLHLFLAPDVVQKGDAGSPSEERSEGRPQATPGAEAPAGKAKPSKPANKRGRKPYDIWEPMFGDLAALVEKRGRLFATCKEAAGYGRAFLKQLAEQRRKEGKGAAVPRLQTIEEKIGESKKRPDLVVG